MTITRKDNSKSEDITPAMPMATAAAFALAQDDAESKKIAAAFRQTIASP